VLRVIITVNSNHFSNACLTQTHFGLSKEDVPT